MSSAYDLIYITKEDIDIYEINPYKSKIGILIQLVLSELPKPLQQYKKFIAPFLIPIEGFEDEKVKGFELVIKENREIEQFMHQYIPFFILKKK